MGLLLESYHGIIQKLLSVPRDLWVSSHSFLRKVRKAVVMLLIIKAQLVSLPT